MRTIADRANLQFENRSFTVAPAELRAEDGTDELGPLFVGVAANVEQPYEMRDRFGEFQETMAEGVFTRSLKQKDDVHLLVNHEGVPLARLKSGTLKLTETPHLQVEARLDGNNPRVQEVRSAMSRGDMDQMSIGFRALRQEWSKDYSTRRVIEARLFDVTITPRGVNSQTIGSLRSLEEALRDLTIDRDQLDEPEIRRAIKHLESLLPAEEGEEKGEELREASTYIADLSVLWAKRLPA